MPSPSRIETLALQLGMPGTQRCLTVHHYGVTASAAGKAYVQGGLHAGELPGMLASRHLIALLDAAAARGDILGEIIVVPMANPIGLDQVINEVVSGRFDLRDRRNFNRHYPLLADAVADAVRDQLGDDAAANVATIRRALRAGLAAQTPTDEGDALRHTLLAMSIDADYVLDLHCDDEAPMHLYMGDALWETGGAELAAQLGAVVTLTAPESGDNPFDEANSAVWWSLREKLGDAHPIPPACLAVTIELRGMPDVSDALAAADAEALFRFLQRRGLIAGDPGPLPALSHGPTPLAGVDMITAPVAGIVAYHKALGDIIAVGDVVADIVNPATGRRTQVKAKTSGPLWSRLVNKVVPAGEVVAKVAGTAPLPGKGKALLTA
jgi:uncharacterized protein